MGASTASVREAVAVLCSSIVAAAAVLLANIDWQWGCCGTEVVASATTGFKGLVTAVDALLSNVGWQQGRPFLRD